MVEFRRLDRDRVRFPTDSDHLIIRHQPCSRVRPGASFGQTSPSPRCEDISEGVSTKRGDPADAKSP